MVELVERARYLGDGQYAVILLGSAICDPQMMSLLVNDLDFDVNARYTNGVGVVYTMLDPENDVYEVSVDGDLTACGNNLVLAESLEIVLNAGADPCLGPWDEPELAPARVVHDWGWPAEIADTVVQFAENC